MSRAEAKTREAVRVTPAVEDYLKAAYLLQIEEPGNVVTVQRLARRLAVAAPSATNMAKRLAELGLLRHQPYRGVELTPAGERVALEVVRHHRLLERYLVQALGYSWDEVHEEAERLEHHISEALEARIAAVLGDPAFDPHGDPIPGPDGSLPDVAEARLVDLPTGRTEVVGRIADQDPERLRYLDRLGIRPGSDVTLLVVEPFDGPLRVRVGDAEHVIGRALGTAIRVAATNPDGESSDDPVGTC